MKIEDGQNQRPVNVVVKEDPGLLVVKARRLSKEIEELKEELVKKEVEAGLKVIH